ncbi:MAG: NAD(+)/NADH kinase [Candidatus Synoicihabitans palmerolidicus]|nr:NAD(+)/NADH kinase [Candidatus Synoicihabitans palmerolidicus]
MPPIRHLAIVVNAQKAGAAEIANDLTAIAQAAKVQVTQTQQFPVPIDFFTPVDACCAIGGDGTLLGIARSAAEAGVPIIGVNRGSLGFLTTFSAEEARTHLAALLQGHFDIAERALLDCSTEPDHHDLALNDVLIKDENHSRLVELSVHANNELVTTYTCDGLLFSSPTGSTAYNLSAGGPLIHPDAEVIALTPICPHTLSNRSIIFRQDVKLRVTPRRRDTCLLVAIDGQRNICICEGGAVEITVSPRRLKLINRASYEHFSVVRTKLKWSGGVTTGH